MVLVRKFSAARRRPAPKPTQPPKKLTGRDIVRYTPTVNERTRKKYATFSKAVYARLHSERQEIPEKHGTKGFKFIPVFSDNNIGTWFSATEKRFVMAFRGTQVSNVEDLLSDVAIVFGKSRYLPRVSEGVRMARSVLRHIKRNYPGHTLELTGHSLGGKVGLNVSTGLELTGYFYNIGSSPSDKPEDIALKTLCTVSSKGVCPALKNVVHFHVVGDPISASAANAVPWKVERQAPTTSMNPHTIDNFL